MPPLVSTEVDRTAVEADRRLDSRFTTGESIDCQVQFQSKSGLLSLREEDLGGYFTRINPEIS